MQPPTQGTKPDCIPVKEVAEKRGAPHLGRDPIQQGVGNPRGRQVVKEESV